MTQYLKVPLAIKMGKKKVKNHYLNLNGYRNWQFHLNNALKVKFFESVDTSHLAPIKGKVHITYTFYYPDSRKRDIDNSLSVVSKFTLDTLVKRGILQEDNYTVVTRVIGEFGGIDKENPRCEVEITQVKE